MRCQNDHLLYLFVAGKKFLIHMCAAPTKDLEEQSFATKGQSIILSAYLASGYPCLFNFGMYPLLLLLLFIRHRCDYRSGSSWIH